MLAEQAHRERMPRLMWRGVDVRVGGDALDDGPRRAHGERFPFWLTNSAGLPSTRVWR